MTGNPQATEVRIFRFVWRAKKAFLVRSLFGHLFMALYVGYYYLACLDPIVQLSWRFMIFSRCCVYFTSNYVLLQHAYTVCKFIAPL
jgi:hypothetical protein